MSKRVLIVAAHLDDEVLGCGGVMQSIAQHGDVHVLNLCDKTNNHAVDLKMTRELREQSVKVSKVLGVPPYTHAGLRDESMDLMSAVDAIEGAILTHIPSVVFTHFKDDVNQDHRTAYEATMIAVGGRPITVMSYEVLTCTERSGDMFAPNWFVPLRQEALDKKKEAMALYTSQVKYPRDAEGIEVLARWRGLILPSRLAEAFILVKGFSW
jgi:LmbE family N-acetylglucosaminyl deacetylase